MGACLSCKKYKPNVRTLDVSEIVDAIYLCNIPYEYGVPIEPERIDVVYDRYINDIRTKVKLKITELINRYIKSAHRVYCENDTETYARVYLKIITNSDVFDHKDICDILSEFKSRGHNLVYVSGKKGAIYVDISSLKSREVMQQSNIAKS